MANSEHLSLIEQGVEVWNNWYQKNKKVIPDFSQANLSNLNLRGVNLNKALLKQTNFNHTDLSQGQFTNANLEGANFLGSNLLDANFKGANLDYVIFAQAVINTRTVMAIKYRQVHEIVNRQTANKNFSGIDLSNSNLFRADLRNAELSNAKLLNVNFHSANLNSAYLHKADLTGAILENADLRNAYFSQANLTSAYLGGALCCGTYFKDAELKFANLKTAKFSQKTMVDLKWYSVWEIVNHGAVKKNLSGTDLSNANLQGVNFEEANLANAKLSNAILRHSNLTNANLTNSDLVGANVCGVDFDQANLKGARLKSVISDRHTKLSTASNQKTSLMVKERPIVETNTIIQPLIIQPSVIQSATPTRIQLNETLLAPSTKPKKQKSKSNLLGILLFGIIATTSIGGYVFWTQNPDYPWSLKLKIWQSHLEQLLPSNQ
jgi:uncharacterized protein YjbI with pentapeptide repeats